MSNLKVFMAITVALVFVAACENVFAFGSPGFLQGSSTSQSAVNMQNKLVADFVAGQVGILNSQAKMAAALGDKNSAAKFQADAKALSTGATEDKLERAIQDSSKASKETKANLSKAGSLTGQAKAEMDQAVPGYIIGIAALVKMKSDYKTFLDTAQQEISSAGFMSAMTVRNKLAVGMFVATHGPSYAKSLASTTGDFLNYAKSNNISIPPDATAALGSM